jgi:hypothetical protein
MNKERAAKEFNRLHKKLNPKCPIPLNKQKGKKKGQAYLTGIVNMLVEQAIGAAICDYDPHVLTTITRNGVPVRTLSRRVDGAFPSSINPVAIWEVKEYYNTKTFGSRVPTESTKHCSTEWSLKSFLSARKSPSSTC